jgi:hypothetical protein
MVRDIEYDNDDPFWKQSGESKSSKSSAANLAMIMVMVAGTLLAAKVYMGGNNAGGGSSPIAMKAPITNPGSDSPATRRPPEPNAFLSWIEDRLPGEKPLKTRATFEGGLTEWASNATNSASWKFADGQARPGRLSLWKPTLEKVDYDVSFGGAIEKKAMSWAFRAADAKNYYATKVVLTRPGQESGASIVRYIMKDATMLAKTELPLPVILHKSREYQFTVSVSGNRFTTLIDGHVIDEWRDDRLRAGGVGFFTEEGEASTLRWVDFRERRGLLGRFMAAAFFLPPWALQ